MSDIEQKPDAVLFATLSLHIKYARFYVIDFRSLNELSLFNCAIFKPIFGQKKPTCDLFVISNCPVILSPLVVTSGDKKIETAQKHQYLSENPCHHQVVTNFKIFGVLFLLKN